MSNVTKEQADEAFNIVVEAIDLALKGTLPLGIDNIEIHMKIKMALLQLSGLMNVLFAKPEQAPKPTLNSLYAERELTNNPSTEPALVAEAVTKKPLKGD